MKRAILVSSFCIGITSILAQAPAVVSTSPGFWAVNVNAATQKEVSVTFDQNMRQGFSSWLGLSSVLPDSQFESKNSEDGRTFSLSVHLQPGKIYAFALNEKSISGVGFQNRRGIPLAPHFLVFQTAGTPGPEDSAPQVLRSFPPAGAQQLDPARTKAVALTFNKQMRQDRHGLHLFENNNPVDLSKSRFGYSADGKTFTLYYDFRSSQTYRIELNSVHDIGFASVNRIPLWPAQILFTTGTPQ